jgi:hypothetical protein
VGAGLPSGVWQAGHTAGQCGSRFNRKPQCGRNLTKHWMLSGYVRAWGRYHSRIYWIDGRPSGPLGRRHCGRGRAVPVRCPSIRRSSSRGAPSDRIKRFLHRLVRHRHESMTTSRGQNEHRSRQLGSRLCGRSARASAPMRDWSRPSVIFERFLPWSRVACAVAH